MRREKLVRRLGDNDRSEMIRNFMFSQTRCVRLMLTLSLLAYRMSSSAVDCQALNEIASKRAVLIPGDDAGRVVTGKGRLQFYSDPNRACKMQGIFIIENQTVDAYTEYAGFTSVVYLRGNKPPPVLGWVTSNRLKRNGIGMSIPLHTILLLKLARVSDAGSKIHHSLHA